MAIISTACGIHYCDFDGFFSYCRLWLPFDELFDASFNDKMASTEAWIEDHPPPGKRLAPVGANAEDDDEEVEQAGDAKSIKSRTQSVDLESNFSSDFWLGGGGGGGNNDEATAAAPVMAAAAAANSEKLEAHIRQLEEDQEELNNSLMSMTSHFAKVQLRLQQVSYKVGQFRKTILKPKTLKLKCVIRQ